jgi:hypothetical protein
MYRSAGVFEFQRQAAPILPNAISEIAGRKRST